MKMVSLASGSKGNAYLFESQGALLLIDCGLSGRELVRRMDLVGADLRALKAVLVTHEHSDHTCGIARLRKICPDAAFYANLMTADVVGGDFYIFENGQPFQTGPFTIIPFSIPHDVSDPVGFVVMADGHVHFHATDIGSPLDSIGWHLSEADSATLESNHDPVLLAQSNRPAEIIRRIRGPRGHLSNDEAASLVERFASPKLKHLSLAHLSRDCNEAHIAYELMRETLLKAGLGNVDLEVLSQDEPGRVWEC